MYMLVADQDGVAGVTVWGDTVRQLTETADAIGLGPVMDISQDPHNLEEIEITADAGSIIITPQTSLARIADA